MSAQQHPDITRERGLFLLHQMLRIRCFEDRCVQLYGELKIRGFLHLCNGEEAVAVGTMQSLTPEDAIVSTYREHGHAIARGLRMEAVMAELYGKRTGSSRGRGGSMHIFDRSNRFYGGNAIVGAGLPLAIGLALAQKLRHEHGLTVCLFGDGAVAEGEFHETLNLASLWSLPVLFVCENNLYAMGTAVSRAQAQTDIPAKARSYGIDAASVNGMDVLEVEVAVRGAAERIHRDGAPVLLEMRTYRFRAHSMFDAQLYRDKAEIEAWTRKDPIALLERQLRDQGDLDDNGLRSIEADVRSALEAAVAFAEASPFPLPEQATDDVYAA